MENAPHNAPTPDAVPSAGAQTPADSAPKGWDSALYGMSDGDNPRRPGDYAYPTSFGSGETYRWQGFLIYFFMWIYGGLLMLNAIPVLQGNIAAESNQFQLMFKYMPGLNILMKGLGIFILLLGAAMIVTRFLLARYKKCALPIFFTVSVLDLVFPVLFPLLTHLAMRPLSSFASLSQLYAIYFAPGAEMPHSLLYPTIIRIALLISNSVYYYRRRKDFNN